MFRVNAMHRLVERQVSGNYNEYRPALEWTHCAAHRTAVDVLQRSHVNEVDLSHPRYIKLLVMKIHGNYVKDACYKVLNGFQCI